MALLSPEQRATLYVWYFGKTKIPMLAYCRPRVLEITPDRCAVQIKLRRRTRNHLNAMYIGVFTIGADLAGGLIAMNLIRGQKLNMAPVFKDFTADFLRRAESAVTFTCKDGPAIQNAVLEALNHDERVNLPVRISATVEENGEAIPVAEMTLTLSLKNRD
ncbi:MAG: DUF4442 domain-containing protein [Lentisphaeria bacterium]|nr:DUF4442 domain-containing protein [Candidatus Neomarinimicrobiota bacterium]MCF7841572.1 DUF4442 domain-containing protein [Lentisphaeria bacterium]